MDDFYTQYREKVLPAVQQELGIANRNAAPRLESVRVNVGMGTYLKTHKDFTPLVENITRITGQRPIVTKSRQSISNFKLRQGQPVGIMVTLRGKRMLDFVNKFVNVVLPRVRDFRGVSTKSFDGSGNYSVGFAEHTMFPEVRLEDDVKPFGLQVTLVTTAHTNREAEPLLRALGFPFRKNQKDR